MLLEIDKKITLKNSMVILGNFHGTFPWKNSMEKSVS
jgi:hypothetical protein